MSAKITKDPRQPLVCSSGAPGQVRVTEALVTELGFRAIASTELDQFLQQGRRVLVHGWTAAYAALAYRYPGQLICLWHSGWTGSELMGECPLLTQALQQMREGWIHLIWLDARDTAPLGAYTGVPIWSPQHLTPETATVTRRNDMIAVGLHGQYSTLPKNTLASLIGCAALPAELHMNDAPLLIGDPRAELLQNVLYDTRHVIHDTLTHAQITELLQQATLLVQPSLSDTWPGLLLEAVYADCPVILSDAIAWSALLPADIQDLCIVRPATASAQIAKLAGHLLSTPDDRQRVVAAQRAALDKLLPQQLDKARRLYRTLGFNVPDQPIATTDKPHILLVVDVPGWAFDQNLRDLAQYLDHQFNFDFWYVADYLNGATPPDFQQYNAIFTPFHRWNIEHLLQERPLLGSLRAQWFWTEKQVPPDQAEYDLVNTYRSFHVVTQRNFDELKEHCPNVVYLTNPVNCDRFKQTAVLSAVASWNGNAQHCVVGTNADVKGFNSIIIPACQKANVPLVYAEYYTNRRKPADMPNFYQQASIGLCASTYEGSSNSVMEAMASGLAVIATDVGNHREMYDSQLQHLGDTGIILVKERTVDAFTQALRELQADPARMRRMGELNRQEIIERWSWAAWAERYAAFLRKAL